MAETILTFNYTLFQEQFPAYANSMTYSESLLQTYWDISINYMSNVGNYGSLQGSMRQYALNLLVAHLLYLSFLIGSGNPNTGSQVPGLMQTATIDKVTVGLTPPPLPNQFQWWLNQTPYGQQLLALLQMNSVGGFYIGGRGAIAAFGYQGGKLPMLTVKVVTTDLLNNLQKAMEEINKTSAKVGWLDKNKYPMKQPRQLETTLKHIYAYRILGLSHEPPNVAYIASIHEFGAPSKKIPARPFLRPTISRKKNAWSNIGAKKSREIILGNSSVYDLFETIAQSAEGEIKKTIKSIWSPALAEGTILARIRKSSFLGKKKGRIENPGSLGGVTKPLIDTGLMLASLTHEVIKE